jgi:glycosyltransferase involved in cell wall biosynthesis
MDPLICNEIPQEISENTIRLKLEHIEDEDFPTVSVVVPTYNRPEFFDLILRNWDITDYPSDKIELIILDDSQKIIHRKITDKRIRYLTSSKKMTIGKKRNVLCKYAKNEYIVHMDDDDWYTPESVATRIRILLHFEKKTGKKYCFGCTKVLCVDLIACQMFEAFDISVDGSPGTISESTMAYSKQYWDSQKWNDESTMTECLSFINSRIDTICTGPSTFIVTQLSHMNNTVQRRITRNFVSSRNFEHFQENMTMYETTLFNDLRARIIIKVPTFKESLDFIKKNYNTETPKLKKEYKNLDQNIKKNPLIIEFIQERLIDKITTTGKDVVYYCGPGLYLNFSNQWNPDSALGGSEEAVVNLSEQLVKNGYNVTVYCCLKGCKTNYNGVNYRNYYEWIPGNLQDITIIWRDPSNCDKKINSKKVFFDVHDVLENSWIDNIDDRIKIMVKSNFHKSLVKNSNVHVIPNGIKLLKIGDKVNNLMICTSSPDRCIVALLNALPLIRKEVPDAEIHWAYGFGSGIIEGGLEKHPLGSKWTLEIKERIKCTKGFVDLGKLDPVEIRDLYEKADLFIYPTYFPEIDCISLTKALSAGCIPVVSNSGAMSEKIGTTEHSEKMINDKLDYSLNEGPLFDEFVERVIKELKNPQKDRKKYNMTNYDWNEIVKKWIDLFN